MKLICERRSLKTTLIEELGFANNERGSAIKEEVVWPFAAEGTRSKASAYTHIYSMCIIMGQIVS